MIWIYTSSIFTLVVYVHVFWYRPKRYSPGYSVGVRRFIPAVFVSPGNRTNPYPACVSFLDIMLEWFILHRTQMLP